MESSWSHRVVEGLVVGITASLVVGLIMAFNDARLALSNAHDLLNVQITLNETLVSEVDRLEYRIAGLELTLEARESLQNSLSKDTSTNVPTFNIVEPTSSQTPLEPRLIQSPPNSLNITSPLSELIEQQRSLQRP